MLLALVGPGYDPAGLYDRRTKANKSAGLVDESPNDAEPPSSTEMKTSIEPWLSRSALRVAVVITPSCIRMDDGMMR
jgi:hypothetical protein